METSRVLAWNMSWLPSRDYTVRFQQPREGDIFVKDGTVRLATKFGYDLGSMPCLVLDSNERVELLAEMQYPVAAQ